MKTHKNKKIKTFKCNLCSYTTKHSTNLKRHQLHSHSEKYKCDECCRKFLSEEALKKHKVNHSENFVCEICEKKFCHKEMLTKHILKKHAQIR